jgi:hypothetical protein
MRSRAGDAAAEHAEERRGEAHDPGQREQQQDAHDHRGHEADAARPGLLTGRQLAGENRDEDHVVHAEHDLEGRERQQGDPCLRVS